MNVLESLVRRFVVDKNRSAKSSERSRRGGCDSRSDLKQFDAKIRLQAVERYLVRHRANQNLARIRAALLECWEDEHVGRTESDEICVVATATDSAEGTRVTRHLSSCRLTSRISGALPTFRFRHFIHVASAACGS